MSLIYTSQEGIVLNAKTLEVDWSDIKVTYFRSTSCTQTTFLNLASYPRRLDKQTNKHDS